MINAWASLRPGRIDRDKTGYHLRYRHLAIWRTGDGTERKAPAGRNQPGPR